MEKDSAVVMVRGKVHTSTPAVRKNRIRIYFYFLLMCFLYFRSKKSKKRGHIYGNMELSGISYSSNASDTSDGWEKEELFSDIN